MKRKFEKKVNWTFKITIDGHGRNCKEALRAALNNELDKIENDYCGIDYEKIEDHEVVDIDIHGSQYGFED